MSTSLFKQVNTVRDDLKYPSSISNNEHRDSYDIWKESPTEDNLSKVLQDLKPTINSALHTFTGGDKSLTTRAYILTKQALPTYDATKGTSLKTHVFNNLKRLNRVKDERSTVIHIPEGVRVDSKSIYHFKNKFMDKHDREPSLEEIADGTGLSIKRVGKALHGGEVPESMGVSEKGDLLNAASTRTKDDIWQDYVYYDLDPVNKKIFEWTTGYLDSKVLPKKEIAAKLKISPAAVSQRVNTIIKRLEEVNAA
jgi:DNA-directed RNA polymerase specialized sigma subunit